MPVWSLPSQLFAHDDVPRNPWSCTTGACASNSASVPSNFNRSYARNQIHSPKPSTSQRPSRVPPHGPFLWFFAHWDSGQRNAMSGNEQSPQSLHLYRRDLLTFSIIRKGSGPCLGSAEWLAILAPNSVNVLPGVKRISCTNLETRYRTEPTPAFAVEREVGLVRSASPVAVSSV